MAVDRGELRYKIQTSGDFKALNQFSAGLQSVKEDMADIKKMSASLNKSTKTSADPKKRGSNAKRLNDIEKRRNAIMRERKAMRHQTLQREAKALAMDKKRVSLQRQLSTEGNKRLNNLKKSLVVRKEMNRLERQSRLIGDKTLSQKRTQVSVERQIAAFKEKQAKFESLTRFAKQQGLAGNRQALADLGFSKQRAQQAGLLAADPKKTISGMERLSGVLKKVGGVADRVTVSITRMFTALVFFSTARQVVTFVKDMIVGMIRFNSVLEQTRLGIASLVIASGTLVTAQGQVLQGQESLIAAQKLASEQVKQLRKEALRTAATFEDLSQAFQVSVAPGLQAGLTLDQIREFTVRISQAAATLGLQQNQLAEEIRSVLQGTITARTTRIATALGITNEDIRNAKEMGKLSEFLVDKFSAFKLAADETLNTFQAIFTNLKDAFMLVAGEGGIGLFENLKQTLKDLNSELVEITEDGIAPKPQALAAFREFGQSLSKILRDWTEAFAGDKMSILENALKSISAVLEGISQFVLGIVDGVKILSKLIPNISAAGGKLARIAGVMTVFLLAAKLVPWSLIIGLVSLIGKGSFLAGMAALSKGALALVALNPVLAALAASAFIFHGALRDIGDELGVINGESASLGESWDLFTEAASESVTGLFLKVKAFIDKIPLWIKVGFNTAKAFILTNVSGLLDEIFKTIFKGFDALKAKAPGLFKSIQAGLRQVGLGDIADMMGMEGSVLASIFSGSVTEVAADARNAASAASREILSVNEGLASDLVTLESQTQRNIEQIMRESAKRRGGTLTVDTPAPAAPTGPTGPAVAVGRPVAGLSETSMAAISEDIQRATRELQLAQRHLTGQSLREAQATLQIEEQKLAATKKLRQQIQEITNELDVQSVALQNSELSMQEWEQLNASLMANQNTLAEALKKREQVELKFNELLEKRIELIKEEAGETRTMTQGIQDGILKFIEDLPNKYQATMAVMEEITTGFVNTLSGSIMDALDPSKSGQDIKHRWLNFGKSIASSILNEIVKSMIAAIAKTETAKAVGNVFSSFFGGTAGAAKGGYIQGFAGGGTVNAFTHPSAGKDPRDTVPAWLRPGEYVIRPEVVRSLGTGFFNAVNDGLLNPFLSLSGLTGLKTAGSLPGGPSGNSFATGGRVSSPAPSGGGGQQIMVVPVMIANDQSAEQIFNGGSQAFRRSMMANQDALKSDRLNRPRTFND